MELETVSPPPPAHPNVQTAQPVTQHMEVHANAGTVRVPESLGYEPAKVDCQNCEKAVMTEITKTPSQSTTIAKWFCGFMAISVCACCCTYHIPEKREWYFDTHHKCSICKNEIAFVGYNQEKITPHYVASRYGK
ncbi:hypothetical protein F5Y19DRAFT_445789 [Xylariaceae sp. FL1651]|nr:hypothetical protein F5Y19DRAFT_445789 [Xylariaceae sp. FL1651]